MTINWNMERPWSSQLEITYGCDNRCPICYKQVLNKPQGEYEYMKPRTANEITTKMNKAGWDGVRIEFAMRGEALLNPYFNKIISIFRKNLPHSHITTSTNGNNLTHKKADQYFKAGGNVFVVDCYDGNINKRKEYFKDSPYKVTDYYEDDFNPYARHPIKTTQVICLMDDIKTKNNLRMTRTLHNWAGNIDYNRAKYYGKKPLLEPLKKKCAKPFREIIFLYDGTIPLCCHDGGIGQNLGNIYKIDDLNQYWKHNKKLNIIRALLYNKERTALNPCKNCDYHGGMRLGFMPKVKQLNKQQVKQMSRYLERSG